MEQVSSKAFDALGPLPIVQAIVGALILFALIYVGIRAIKDKNGTHPVEHMQPWVTERILDELRHLRGTTDRTYERVVETTQKVQENKQLIEFLRNEFFSRPDRIR